jgi:hypothetical protein
VLSLGVVTRAVTALSTILSAISSDRVGRRTLIMASCGDHGILRRRDPIAGDRTR